jgi:hypothetical protein
MDSENQEQVEKNLALQRMQGLDSALDEYEASVGLSVFREKGWDDTRLLLNLSRREMEAMTPQQCGEAALMLGGFSFYIQRAFNRETARVKWADSNLKKMLAGQESQFRGSWDSQFYQAVNQDDYAKKMLKLRDYAKQRELRLTYLGTSIKNMSDLFVNLQRAKGMK